MEIRCENVDIFFHASQDKTGNGKQVYLKNCSLTVPESRLVLLYGPNGSGKTSFFNVLCGLSKPKKGNVYWNGWWVKRPGKANQVRHRYISMIFSEFIFMQSLSVRENLVMPAVFAGKDKEYIQDRLGMLQDVFRFEDPRIDLGHISRQESIGELSSGQKALVSIARAFMLDTPFVFADEMFRSLDGQNAAMLWDRIINTPELGIRQGRTLFLISHMEAIKSDPHVDIIYTINNKTGQLEQKK